MWKQNRTTCDAISFGRRGRGNIFSNTGTRLFVCAFSYAAQEPAALTLATYCALAFLVSLGRQLLGRRQPDRSPAGARRRRRAASAFSGRRTSSARRPGHQRKEGLRVAAGAAGPHGGDTGQLVAGRRRVRVCIGGRTACLEAVPARAEHSTVARHVGARARGLRHSHI